MLAHNLGRAYETIFREFEGASSIEAVTTIPQGGTGDVKYHHGAQGTYQLPDDQSVLVRLESNPSHLEYVGPVVEGATRAVQTTRQGTHAQLDTNAAVPIILHGDAAFPGQGVVAETFNLQALDGYTVGGSLHLITNNQVGDEGSILVRLESNPSHLEYVGPVVEGATRAVQTTRTGTHATLDTNAAVPIILHGDAAFPGQGVVAETFNLQGRGLPRPGRCSRDVQPAGARRLHGRRLHAPDPEQPGRLHHRPGRLALHALGV